MTKRTELEREALAQLTATSAAWLIGMSPSGFRSANAPKGENGYSGRDLVRWHLDRRLAQMPTSADPMLVSGNSPALERYRLARAKLAESELAEKTGVLVRVDVIKLHLGRWASHLRRLGERLQTRYGPEAAAMLNDCLEDCRAIAQLQPKETSHDGDTTPDA